MNLEPGILQSPGLKPNELQTAPLGLVGRGSFQNLSIAIVKISQVLPNDVVFAYIATEPSCCH